MPTPIRVFTALTPEPAQCRWLAGQLPRNWPTALRPVPAGNWHVTLHFHGALPLAEVEVLIDELQAVALPGAPEVETAGWIHLPPRRPAVLALALKDLHGQLAGLRQCLPATGQAARERRAFCPHLSVARYRQPLPGWQPEAAAPRRWRLCRLALFQSLPVSGGVRYEPLWSASLADQA